MFAYFIHDFSPFVFRVGSWGPRWYGVAYVLSFLVGWWLYRILARRQLTDMPEEKVGDFITLAAIFGVMVGGRLGWILFYGWRETHDSRWWFIEVWKGGMSSHGGILALVLFTLWFARRHRLSWTGIGDSLCVVACLGLFLVRCANFVNGELYGKPATVSWAVQFPQELLEPGSEDLARRSREAILSTRPHNQGDTLDFGFESASLIVNEIQSDPVAKEAVRGILTPRHPSQLYEAFLEGLVLFSILWLLRTRARLPRGVITGAFFIFYATLRIIGETFRVPDPAWSWMGLSAGQTLSLFFYALGTCFVAWGFRTQQYELALTRGADTGNAKA